LIAPSIADVDFASACAVAKSVAARPLFASPAAACSAVFIAALVESGIAPAPRPLQGLISLASKPAPPGPTMQFSV
jgi:hypothetical protein